MQTSESIDQLAASLVAFQAAMAPVGKDADNPFFSSRYVSLTAVATAAMPLLTKNDLAITQWPCGWGEGEPGLTTRLVHASGQWMEDTVPLLVSKQDSQGHGSALTYMRRYAMCAILGIVADEDDDGNSASGSPRAPRPVRSSSPVTRAALRPPPGQRQVEPEPLPPEPEPEWDDEPFPSAGEEIRPVPTPLAARVPNLAKAARAHPPRAGGATEKQVNAIKAMAKKIDPNLDDAATLALYLGQVLDLDEIYPEELSKDQASAVFTIFKQTLDG